MSPRPCLSCSRTIFDVRLGGLAVLMAAFDPVDPSVLSEMGAGLLEMKRHPRRDALFPELLDPRKVAEPGVISRFSARYHFLNGRGQIQREIHPLEKRLTDNEFVPNRAAKKSGRRSSARF